MLGGSASRRDRLRVSSAPDWSMPLTASAAAIPAIVGISAAPATHTAIPTIRTTLRVRSRPGQVLRP
ncbi:hypothetical protein ADL01_23245 [Streptomyces sp. NRRL WC-3618]|nr:hypothetical protein ADL01_23245 [Streptomyces sp. NRRL WC-3618]